MVWIVFVALIVLAIQGGKFDPRTMIDPTYNLWLVLASLLVAIAACYVAFGVALRMGRSRGALRWGWLTAGGVVIGWGVWAMHFIGMLAYDLGIPLGFAVAPTLISMLPAMLGAGIALWLTTRPHFRRLQLLLAGLALGIGVGSMHYTGMAAMRMSKFIQWNWWIVALSVLIAIGGSIVTLGVSRRALRRERAGQHRTWQLLRASVTLGVTIASMHYVAMAAAEVPAGSICLSAGSFFHGTTLAVGILVVTLALLGGTWAATLMHARLERQARSARRDLHHARQQVQSLQERDASTGLPNRTVFLRQLRRSMARVHAGQTRVALLIIRVRRLGQLTEALGHGAGEVAIREMAHVLRDQCPARAMLARYADNAFAMLVEDAVDAGAVQKQAEALLECMRRPIMALDQTLSLDGCIGAALAPRDTEDPDQLLRLAFSALNHAAEVSTGFVLFQRGMQRALPQRLSLLADLRVALAAQQLTPHYQMIWNLRSGTPAGAEALVRWPHPHLGMLPPDEFVPLAEEHGLAVALDQVVIDRVATQVRAWRQAGIHAGPVAVNLTIESLEREDFFTRLRNVVDTHGIAMGDLRFELTESMAMMHFEPALSHLYALREQGCSVILDDFGTGHSSLARLRELPLTTLKIDQRFVRSALQNRADRDIVEAIVALAHKLRLDTIAEGVETAEQADWLASLGCDAAQGYYYARPMPAERYIAHLRQASAAVVMPRLPSYCPA